MSIRIILLALITIVLIGCRANPSERDTDPQTSRSLDRPPVEKMQSAPIEESADIAPAPATGGSYLAGDGPGSDTPSNLDNVPDAVPQAEPLHRYANRPYTVLGKNYTPLTQIGTYKERGVASWYGKKFHGQKTSIGEIYDMYGMTAAHTTLPIPSYVRVTNLQNNKSVVVRVNDRGPFLHERVIDLSYTAASKLGIINSGKGQVEVESLIPGENAPAPISPIYKEPIQVTPLAAPAPSRADGKIYLQLGAFNSQRGAEEFLKTMSAKLSDSGKQLKLVHLNGMVKVRIGPYDSASTARSTAQNMHSRLGFKPMLILH